ncbi:MAG: hypothetical protein ACREM8_07380 [Vulcanimicrobiaceae bacterium]
MRAFSLARRFSALAVGLRQRVAGSRVAPTEAPRAPTGVRSFIPWCPYHDEPSRRP